MAIDIIKYDGDPDIFAWKYPSEELGTWTQLIVNESQEAVLVKSGKICDVFGSGRHTLETANIPLLNNLINLPFGGRSPFTAEVWYVNKAYNLDIKWGTPTPIQIQDPKYGIFIPVRSNGAFGIHVSDSEKFLVKLVSTMGVFDKMSVTKYFRSLYVTTVKETISTYLIHKRVSVLEINAYIDELSQHMKDKIQPIMDEYGIELVSFHVNEISVPEDDAAVKQLKDALSKRAEMNIIGYSYQQERSFNTLDNVSKTASSGGSPLLEAGMSVGIGLGMGKSVASGFNNIAQEIKVSEQSDVLKECPNCRAQVPANQRFCGACGFEIEKDSSVKGECLVCSVCGDILFEGQKFCSGCGKKIVFCSHCGNDIPQNAEECPACGFEVLSECPNCGNKISPSANFCSECGQALINRCRKCDTEIIGSPKFCPECGEKL